MGDERKWLSRLKYPPQYSFNGAVESLEEKANVTVRRKIGRGGSIRTKAPRQPLTAAGADSYGGRGARRTSPATGELATRREARLRHKCIDGTCPGENFELPIAKLLRCANREGVYFCVVPHGKWKTLGTR
jgi:hypothetical protein